MVRRLSKVLFGATCILSLTTLVWAQRGPRTDDPARQKKIREMRALGGQGVEEGKPAPDFDLKLLKAYDLEPGEDGKSRQSVKLSTYRDKKPVVLIFGSYT